MAEALPPEPSIADFPDLLRAASLPADPAPPRQRSGDRLVGPLPAALLAWLDHDPGLAQLAGGDLAPEIRPGPRGVQLGLLGTQPSPQPERRPLLRENQGVVTWSLAPVPGEDPPVELRRNDTDGGARWRPHAPSFSAFAWARCWDLAPATWVASVEDLPVSSEVIARALEGLPEGPRTEGWPRARTWRRRLGEARLTLSTDADGASDWILAAGSRDALEAALGTLSGSLPQVLHDHLRRSIRAT